MSLTPEDKREIEHLIADQLEAESIAAKFTSATEAEREEIAHAIATFMSGRQASRRRPENVYTPRWTQDGADVNTSVENSTTVSDQRGHKGPTLPRWIDQVGGHSWLDPDDPQIVHFRGGGGGADCMFDFLVSSCWTGTEGLVMPTTSGCTYKIYSTVKAAAAQATIDFPFGSTNINDTAVLFICGAVYAENNIVVNSDQRWYGSGIDSTVIGSLAASLTLPNVVVGPTTGCRLWTSNLTIRASTASSILGVRLAAACELKAYDSKFLGGTTYAIGVTSTTQLISLAPGCLVRGMGIDGVAGDCTVRAFGVDFIATGGAQTAVRCGDKSQILGGSITNYSEGVRVFGQKNDVQIKHVDFDGNTTDVIVPQAAGLTDFQAIGNAHTNCTTAYDISELTDSTNLNNVIAGNIFGTGCVTGIKFPAGAASLQMDIHDNTAAVDTALYSGVIPVGVRMWDNKEGYVFKDTMRGNALWGLVGTGALDLKLWWPAFSLFFGNTKVNVAAGSFTYASLTPATYYVSVDSAGVLTADTAGAFPANQFPIAIVTTASNRISAIEYYDGILRTTASGAPPAPAHNHEIPAAVDGATASTTAPYGVVRVPNACTITGVFVKTAENITIGATAWIGDIHKIAAADINTDGQGTTIYTTQANRPTITNTNMGNQATAPDVTALADGDWLAFYTDQAGSNATFVSFAVEVSVP